MDHERPAPATCRNLFLGIKAWYENQWHHTLIPAFLIDNKQHIVIFLRLQHVRTLARRWSLGNHLE